MATEIISQIEKTAKSLGVTINQLCREAGIARSTFTRLKSGDTEGGNFKTISKIQSALSAHEKLEKTTETPKA